MTKSGSTIEFLYNADGLRTSKKVNNVEHIYTLNGTQIVSESWGNNLLIYLYDESGSPIGMKRRSPCAIGRGLLLLYAGSFVRPLWKAAPPEPRKCPNKFSQSP